MFYSTSVELDSYDLISIETLIDLRIGELETFQAEQIAKQQGEGVEAYLAEDVLIRYRDTRKKIRAGIDQINQSVAALNGQRMVS